MHADDPADHRPADSDERRPDPERDEDRETGAEGGAEGGEHSGGAPVPFAPDKDDHSAFGDTDQHSDA